MMNDGSSRGSSAASSSAGSVLRLNFSARSRKPRSGNWQNGKRDQFGKGKEGASPAEERDENVDQLRESHGSDR